MSKRQISNVALVFLGILLGAALQPFKYIPSFAQAGCQTFSETGKTVCGKFLTYWQQHGGLAQQGFPISSQFNEVSDLDGKTYSVQYFERSVFEAHPENAAPYDVLLSQLGTFRYKAKYPNGEPGGAPQPTTPPQSGNPLIGTTVKWNDILAGQPLEGKVTDAKEAANIPKASYYEQQNAKGKFVIAIMHVDNKGTKPATPTSTDLKLKDSKGRTFDMAEFGVQIAAGAYFKLESVGHTVQPGLPEDYVFVWDVPADATGYSIVPRQ